MRSARRLAALMQVHVVVKSATVGLDGTLCYYEFEHCDGRVNTISESTSQPSRRKLKRSPPRCRYLCARITSTTCCVHGYRRKLGGTGHEDVMSPDRVAQDISLHTILSMLVEDRALDGLMLVPEGCDLEIWGK
eukprot:573157-Amphidinium_carterae.1